MILDIQQMGYEGPSGDRHRATLGRFADVRDAIAREKQIKGWSRKKKDELILTKNAKWSDLAVTVLGLEPVKGVPWEVRGKAGGA